MGSRFSFVLAAFVAALVAAPFASAGADARPAVTWLRGEGNYTKAHRGPAAIDYIVVHVTEGSFWGSVRWLQNEHAHASSHYVVSRTGKIVQLVHDSDIAWHAGNWSVNERSVGIEHEGMTQDPVGFTDAEYTASAKLAAYIARRSVMPIDRSHFIGHNEVPHPSRPGVIGGADAHTDPGPYWNWNRYLRLVRKFAAVKRVPPLKIRSSLAPGARVEGRLPWAVRTTRKVARVEFRVDGRLLWRDHRPPYAFAAGRGLNTALLRNGAHTLEVRAIPPKGKVVLDRTAVRVRNRAFELTTAKLHDGQDVSGVVRVRANVRGATSHAITLFVDGKPVSRDARRPFALRWDSRRARDGRHTLKLVALARDGRSAERVVRVLVHNTVVAKPKPAPKPKPKPPVKLGPPPEVVSQSLTDGAAVSGTVDWSAQTRGSVGSVEFLVDGRLIGTRTERPITVSWDTTAEIAGEHELTVRAVARDGRVAENRIRIVVAPPAPA